MTKRYSYSRRIMLDTCMRQYFYQYYATDKACPLDRALKAEIRRLKNLSNCDMAAGKILEAQIRLHLIRGGDWSSAWFIQRALREYDDIIKRNREPSKEAAGVRPAQEGGLLEFVLRDPAADEQAERGRSKLAKALQNYFDGPQLVELRSSVQGAALIVGKKISGLRVREWTIGGEIDLLIRQSRSSRIIDWKIGHPQGTMDSLQLFVYGWYAANDPSTRGTTITAQRAFLGCGELEAPTTITSAHIQRGRARVLQDIELMNELDAYGRDGVDEVFTPCMKENVCRRCKFQTVCPKAASAPVWKQTSGCLPLFQGIA